MNPCFYKPRDKNYVSLTPSGLDNNKNVRYINPLPHNVTYIDLAVENIVRKGEIACNKQFLIFSLFSTL